MKKAILVLENLSITAITKDGVYISTKESLKSLKKKKDLQPDGDLAIDYFNDNENKLFEILDNVEFENKKHYSSFEEGEWRDKLISQMEAIKIDSNGLTCNTFSHRHWGGYFPIIFDVVVIGLRTQYIKIKKNIVKEMIDNEEWTFTFSTYDDDLVSINYQKAEDHLNSKFQNLPIKYANDEIMQLTNEYLDNNVYHLAHREKVERNMIDLDNDKSVYVRLDKPFISKKDIYDFIEKFKVKRYKALL